ncbi:NAD(P)-dependent oxidoreductase [Phytohabitans rumicis]
MVRDPARHEDLRGPGVTVVTGDVTDAVAVAELAAGHRAAVNTAARMDVPAEEFFPAAARALTEGLLRAGVGRLVAVGVGSTLETAPGVAVHDAPDFPAEYRDFSVGHAAQFAVLEAADPRLDWVLLVPPPVVLDDTAARTGRYRTGGAAVLPGAEAFSYADLAAALVDEIDTPRHHRALVAVAP